MYDEFAPDEFMLNEPEEDTEEETDESEEEEEEEAAPDVPEEEL
jgi:hypothetical protein